MQEAARVGIPVGWSVLELDFNFSTAVNDGSIFHIVTKKMGEKRIISNACLVGERYQLPTSERIVKSLQSVMRWSSVSPFGPRKQMSFPVTSSNGGVESIREGFRE